MQVLATVLGCIRRPQDVFALSAASEQLHRIARHAPLNLRICSPKVNPLSAHGEQERRVRTTLHGVMNAFKGLCHSAGLS